MSVTNVIVHCLKRPRRAGRAWRRCTAVLLGVVAAATGRAGPAVEIRHWMWDSTQLPAYRAAARAFEAANPDIRIRLHQVGWSSYWLSLTTALISESAPDVFTNHLSRYPELLANGTLLDLAPYAARDGVSGSRYLAGLYDAWSKDGGQYGLPKDWDTIALVYNRDLLREAGVSPEELEALEWNPRDGGTFGRMISRLARDAAGENGLSPRFDSRRVVRYGLLREGRSDGYGQTDWSHLALSNGFRHYDGPWSGRFHYDDPRLVETLAWLYEMGERRRVLVPAAESRQTGATGLFAAGKGTLAWVGSWSVNWLQANCRFEIGFAPLPRGPEGRVSMFNGLGDSIWSGSRHPEQAWRWVSFLGSREGQMLVAGHGVVLPAIREAAERATAVMATNGADVSVFLRQALEPGGTFMYPTVERGSDLFEITRAGMDRIFLGGADIEATLRAMNIEVNALFVPRP